MAEQVLKTRIALHRDLEANYIATTIYRKGEVCLIDTTSRGLRVKVGDGETVFSELPYIDELLIEEINERVLRGYYLNGTFYKDVSFIAERELPKYLNSIYIDIITNTIYTYDGNAYISVNDTLPKASANLAGILKLYQVSGTNIDGTMSQKAITDSISNIKFDVDPEHEDCLILSLPWS